VEQGVRAIEASATYLDRVNRWEAEDGRRSNASPVKRLRQPAVAGVVLPEPDARRLLRRFGLGAPGEVVVEDPRDVAEAARRVGLPVAVKIVSDTITHRSDLGLVSGRVTSARGAATAARMLLRRAREADREASVKGLLVQGWIDGAVELMIGATCLLGPAPLVVLAKGGRHVELGGSAVTRVAPVSEPGAEEMLQELDIYPLFEGYRGSPALDKKATVRAIAAMSRFALAARDWLGEAEVNPLCVLPEGRGALGVDALITVRDVRSGLKTRATRADSSLLVGSLERNPHGSSHARK
jgi:succinyl-CoA synthetase beta subunit